MTNFDTDTSRVKAITSIIDWIAPMELYSLYNRYSDATGDDDMRIYLMDNTDDLCDDDLDQNYDHAADFMVISPYGTVTGVYEEELFRYIDTRSIARYCAWSKDSLGCDTIQLLLRR